MPRVTLQTVADRVGVSRMTVSNAFSRPDQLSTDLRQRILAAAVELGYTGPDPAARALARGATGAVGVLLTDSLEFAFTDEISTRLLAAIASELAATGLGLTLLTSNEHAGFLPARDIPMDGALVYSCDRDSEAIEWLKKRRIPLVFIDQRPVPGYPCVNVDDRAGAVAGAHHLLDLGHRRVAVVTCVKDAPAGPIALRDVLAGTYNVAARMRGWLDVLEPAGITPLAVNAVNTTVEAGYVVAEALELDAVHDRPTAVLTYSDSIAVGVAARADEHGLVLPADLSIVGFDDATFAARARPPLTTIRQDVHGKGVAAAAGLRDLITRRVAPPQPRARHTLLPTELVVRASTARPA